MRQTNHSLVMHEISVVDGKGLVILGPVNRRREDVELPLEVRRKMLKAKRSKEEELEWST